MLENVDELIFKLCILGGITDERGKLFVARENFFVAFEMLEPWVLFYLINIVIVFTKFKKWVRSHC